VGGAVGRAEPRGAGLQGGSGAVVGGGGGRARGTGLLKSVQVFLLIMFICMS